VTPLLAIAARELGAMFRTPVGWVVTALYALLTAVLFTLQTIDPGAPATLRYFFTPAAWLLMIVAPALSMRLFSEEYKAQTIEPLATAPVGPLTIVLGKYLGAVASVAAHARPHPRLPGRPRRPRRRAPRRSAPSPAGTWASCSSRCSTSPSAPS
jgi:ABC-type transport system involved in multi-copper enzyme maturation permease subunit